MYLRYNEEKTVLQSIVALVATVHGLLLVFGHELLGKCFSKIENKLCLVYGCDLDID